MNEPLIQLSNGENKRLQILEAVLRFPALLILDEPFTGLDAEGRKMLEGILAGLANSGQQMLLLTSRVFVPSCFNRYARLQDGKLQFLNSRPRFLIGILHSGKCRLKIFHRPCIFHILISVMLCVCGMCT